MRNVLAISFVVWVFSISDVFAGSESVATDRLAKLQEDISEARSLEKEFGENGHPSYDKVIFINNAYCNLSDYYFEKGDVVQSAEYLHLRNIEVRDRGYHIECVEQCANKLADYYYSKGNFAELFRTLSHISNEEMAAKYLIERNDKERARQYLEQRIALGEEKAARWPGFASILYLRAELSDDFAEYKKWWDEILKYRLSKAGSSTVDMRDYYVATGQVEKAIEAYENAKGWESNEYEKNQYNVLTRNRDEDGAVLSMYLMSLKLPVMLYDHGISIQENILKSHPNTKLKKDLIAHVLSWAEFRSGSAHHLDYLVKLQKQMNLEEWEKTFSFPGPQFPFVDLNNIMYVQRKGDAIVFYAQNGIVQYAPSVNKWSYRTIGDTNTVSVPSRYFPDLERIKSILPSWNPKGAYTTIVDADSLTNPKWILTTISDEGGGPIAQYLADVENKRAFKFPAEYIQSFLVVGNEIWLGSAYGIINVDMTTGKRTDYVTYPAYHTIKAISNAEKGIYYLSDSYGLFYVNNGEISPVEKVNVITKESGLQLLDMVAEDGKLYILGRRINKGGYLAGDEGTSFTIYDSTKREAQTLKSNVNYADTLYQDGDNIIAYGSLTEGNEDYFNAVGGAFLYNKRSNSLQTLFSCPVVDIYSENGKLKLNSLIVDGSNVWARTLVLQDQEMPPTLISEQRIARSQPVGMSGEGPCFSWLDSNNASKELSSNSGTDDVAYEKQSKIYNDYQTNKEKRVDLTPLKKLKVKLSTVQIYKDPVEILGFK